MFGTSKLDLSIEERENECVPIDSDDELFDIPSLSKSGRQSSLPSVTTRTSSTPSIISYIKGKLYRFLWQTEIKVGINIVVHY